MATLKIMPLGDSLTDGYTKPLGYREPLWNSLNNTDLNGRIDFVGSRSVDPYEYEGGPGNTIESITQLKVSGQIPWVKEDPDALLLMAGTNNLRYFRTPQDFATDANSTAQKLENLIVQIRDQTPGTEEIFVASIPYININGGFYQGEKDLNGDGKENTDLDQSILNQEIEAYSDHIKDLADRYDHVHFVDVNRLFREGQVTIDTFKDGVHPTSVTATDTYSKMADTWFRELNPVLHNIGVTNINLINNPPPITPELAAYIPTVKGSDPLIGFKGGLAHSLKKVRHF